MSNKQFKTYFFLGTLMVLFGACSDYSKLLKGQDNDLKFKAGKEYYQSQKYDKALYLFEDVLAAWKGQERSEEVYFYYCYTQYGMGNLPAASFHFKSFTEAYFTSKHLIECAFMVAQCEYEMVMPVELDQSQTIKAIEQLQLFINVHPNSNYVDSCNTLIDNLRSQLIEKQYNKAQIYYKTEMYKSAITTFQLVLQDYPSVKNKEEIEYYIVNSSYQLADKSVKRKELERWKKTIERGEIFLSLYGEDSKYASKVKGYVRTANKKIKILNAK